VKIGRKFGFASLD